jgi:hypothetical protein
MKKLLILSSVILIFVISSAFSFWKEKERSVLVQQPDAVYTVPEFVYTDALFIPGYGKTFLGFKEAIAFKESRGIYTIVNSLGYLGKYQFGIAALNTLRINNSNYFLYTPQLQEKAFRANCNYNKWLLQDEINQYEGKEINGIKITESGIIAAAHLAGAGSVKRYLHKNGKSRKIVDAYGTSIEQYLSNYAGYDVSFLKATKYPTL